MKFILLAIIGLTVAARTVCAGCPICGGGNSTLVDQVEQVKDLSVSWLAAQQNIDGSWPSLNTQNAILGLQLADPSWFTGHVPEERLLTTSTLEYELMQYLLSWRTSGDPIGQLGISAGRLGQYMLAMQSVCISVDDFYENRLQVVMNRLLRRKDTFTNFFAYSFSILSLCSGNFTIYKRSLLKLVHGTDRRHPCSTQFDVDPGHNIDILSLEVMAMVCARDQAIQQGIRRWDRVLSARVQCIIDGQSDDGSFGNAITTSLAVQALTAAEASQSTWNCVDAVEFLLTQQTNGDFGGVASTSQIIPFLNCNNFGSLREISETCSQLPPPMPSRPVPTVIEPGDDTVTFDIEVRANGDVESYQVTILNGENLYFGMIRLADLNNDFTFESSGSAFGESIDAINGVSDDSVNSLYWTIHIGQEGTFAPKGIEGLFPSDDEVYIFILTDFS
ncbi:hypothetical protein BSL78_08228 [Apostichopus japonicus]|uniref:DUF4430 domain-containing protein n=1 Tax=Stichopus japonicus TaxID=307972 RepID=A0A2G8L3Q4_STIJA|nr:hypothetical protein BSL78_08228 [Apostichopus japonicus]